MPLEDFFAELDALWGPIPAVRLRLRIVGSTALMPKCVRNLHRVERDFYGVDETEIELPSWVADE